MNAPLRPTLLVLGALSLGGVVAFQFTGTAHAETLGTLAIEHGKDGGHAIELGHDGGGHAIELGHDGGKAVELGHDGGGHAIELGHDGGGHAIELGHDDGGHAIELWPRRRRSRHRARSRRRWSRHSARQSVSNARSDPGSSARVPRCRPAEEPGRRENIPFSLTAQLPVSLFDSFGSDARSDAAGSFGSPTSRGCSWLVDVTEDCGPTCAGHAR